MKLLQNEGEERRSDSQRRQRVNSRKGSPQHLREFRNCSSRDYLSLLDNELSVKINSRNRQTVGLIARCTAHLRHACIYLYA